MKHLIEQVLSSGQPTGASCHSKSMLGHQSHPVSIETLPASPAGPWRPHTPPCPAPLSLFSPLMRVITVKLGKVVSVPSTTTSCLPVRKELLIYHNTDMKMTSPGNNNIIIIICASAYEEMQMNTDAAACFGMFEKLRVEEGI